MQDDLLGTAFARIISQLQQMTQEHGTLEVALEQHSTNIARGSFYLWYCKFKQIFAYIIYHKIRDFFHVWVLVYFLNSGNERKAFEDI